MAVDIAEIGLQFMQEFGLLAIVILLILDGALLLPVFPGELVLIMAVSQYVTDVPSLIGIILLTSAAAIVGSILLYGIVRIGGRPMVSRFPGFFMMPPKRRERLEHIFQRPIGQVLVLVLRLIPLTRILVNIPAGLAKMPFVRFVLLSSIGIIGYHAAFLWFAYAVNQPGSELATQKEQLEAAYTSPAWAFIESNQVYVIVALLFIGVILVFKTAIQMYRNPMEATGSPIGWLTTVVLVWGGIALAVATYMEPAAVLSAAALGGVDLVAAAIRLGTGPLMLLWITSAFSVLFGVSLSRMRRSAHRHRRTVRKSAKRAAKRRRREAKRMGQEPESGPEAAPVVDDEVDDQVGDLPDEEPETTADEDGGDSLGDDDGGSESDGDDDEDDAPAVQWGTWKP